MNNLVSLAKGSPGSARAAGLIVGLAIVRRQCVLVMQRCRNRLSIRSRGCCSDFMPNQDPTGFTVPCKAHTGRRQVWRGSKPPRILSGPNGVPAQQRSGPASASPRDWREFGCDKSVKVLCRVGKDFQPPPSQALPSHGCRYPYRHAVAEWVKPHRNRSALRLDKRHRANSRLQ